MEQETPGGGRTTSSTQIMQSGQLPTRTLAGYIAVKCSNTYYANLGGKCWELATEYSGDEPTPLAGDRANPRTLGDRADPAWLCASESPRGWVMHVQAALSSAWDCIATCSTMA